MPASRLPLEEALDVQSYTGSASMHRYLPVHHDTARSQTKSKPGWPTPTSPDAWIPAKAAPQLGCPPYPILHDNHLTSKLEVLDGAGTSVRPPLCCVSQPCCAAQGSLTTAWVPGCPSLRGAAATAGMHPNLQAPGCKIMGGPCHLATVAMPEAWHSHHACCGAGLVMALLPPLLLLALALPPLPLPPPPCQPLQQPLTPLLLLLPQQSLLVPVEQRHQPQQQPIAADEQGHCSPWDGSSKWLASWRAGFHWCAPAVHMWHGPDHQTGSSPRNPTWQGCSLCRSHHAALHATCTKQALMQPPHHLGTGRHLPGAPPHSTLHHTCSHRPAKPCPA